MSASGVDRHLVDRAALLLEAGRGAEAESLLRRHLASQPEDAEAWHALAEALGVQERASDMLDAANRSVGLAPDDALGHYLASLALVQLELPDEAVRAAEEAVRLFPEAWPFLSQLAVSLAALQAARRETLGGPPESRDTMDRARELARRAVLLGPEEADTHFALGFVEQTAGRRRESKKSYRAALELDPGHALSHNNLAVLAFDRALLVSGTRGLRAGLGEDPQSQELRHNLEHLAVRALWVGWLGLVVLALAGWGLLYVVAWPVRAAVLALGLVVMLVALWRIGRSVPRGAGRLVLRGLVRAWQGWIFGTLALLALFVVAALMALPDEAAKGWVDENGYRIFQASRVGLLVPVLIAAAERPGRRK